MNYKKNPGPRKRSENPGIYKRGKWWWQISGRRLRPVLCSRAAAPPALFSLHSACQAASEFCRLFHCVSQSAEVVMVTSIVDHSGNDESDQLEHLLLPPVEDFIFFLPYQHPYYIPWRAVNLRLYCQKIILKCQYWKLHKTRTGVKPAAFYAQIM